MSFCMATADAITPEWLSGIARISSTPCSVPSSPGRPCSMLRATSGLTVVSTAAMSRPTSMRVTRWPRRASASAQALPERNDISRSADQPPIRTATCLLILRPTCDADPLALLNRTGYRRPASSVAIRRAGRARRSTLRRSDPHDLPLELHAGIFFDASTHRLAQRLDVGGGGTAEIDQKIAVHLRHLRAPDFEAAAAGGIDELPRFVTGRVLEGRAAGAALDRLGCLARFGDLLHLCGDRGRIAGRALEQRLREDDVVGRAAMTIAVVHVAVAEDAQPALSVDPARLDQRILGLAAVGAAVHAQRTAHRAGDAAEEGEPRDRRHLRGAADFHVRRSRAGADAPAVFDFDLAEAATETNDDARHAAVAYDQVGAEPNDDDGDLRRQLGKEIG